jgi:hypothetical protein
MSSEVKIQITQPILFTRRAILILGAYTIFMFIPLLEVIFLEPVIYKLFQPAIANAAFLAGLGMAMAIPFYLWPFCMGNSYVLLLVRRLGYFNENGFIVQLTTRPRLRSGFWSVMDDADDIGFLKLGAETLEFNGDSTMLSIPFAKIRNIRKKNIGYRGVWIAGSRIVIEVVEPAGNNFFEFFERSSISVPESRRTCQELFECLSAQIPK